MKCNKVQSGDPSGLRGAIALSRMKKCHKPIFDFSLSKIEIKDNSFILDIGCGEGTNIKAYLDRYAESKVAGIDISKLSCKKTVRNNKKAFKEQRCVVMLTDIKEAEFQDSTFDLISAFCTLKFWNDLDICFKNIYRMLNKDGIFIIGDHGRYDVDEVIKLLYDTGFTKVEKYTKDDINTIVAHK